MPLKQYFTQLGQKFGNHRFLTTSLILHIVVLTLLGGVVLFKNSQSTDVFIGNEKGIFTESEEPVAEAEQPAEFNEPEAGEESSASNNMQASAISALATSPTSWNVSAPVGEMSFGNRLDSTMTGGNGIGRGNGSGSGSGGKGRMSGRLAGLEIKADKLGVVLDISGSAHPYLQYPLREIDQSFSNCMIVLYPGCGMKKDGNRGDYDVRPARNYPPEAPADPKACTKINEILYQVKSMKGVENIMDDFFRRDTVYATGWSCDKKLTIFGVHFALEKVMRSNVDVLYWFADFQDSLDGELVEDFAKELKRRKITLYCHNFAGKFSKPEKEAVIRKLAEDTGGKLIMVVPGKGK